MNNNTKLSKILTIAGSDSGGGAGIQADIKTITALGGYASTVITAITAQNTLGVTDVINLPIKIIENQFSAIANDIGIDAIKIGMLSNNKTINLIKNKLKSLKTNIPIVLDPVMVAKGGHKLLLPGAEQILVKELIPICTIITPNIPEAELITKKNIKNVKDMEISCKIILKMGIKNVLMKGGHLDHNTLTDVLLSDNKITHIKTKKINTKNTHGTGCTLSSAIACSLGQRISLNEAVSRAHKYVNHAIRYAPNIGKGNGPLNHLINI